MTQIAIGQKIRQFEIVDRIGEGGMGEVFKAKDRHLGRLVVLKALKPGLMTSSVRDRFLREARVASGLSHPNIVTIFDAFTEDDTDFIAMELIVGKTLDGEIQQGPLAVVEAVDFALQIADALVTAHRAGVIHRDLKPLNIMVTGDRVIKVLDFGIAKLVAPEGNQDWTSKQGATATTVIDAANTSSGQIIGSAPYMSPEQAEGKTIDARSDLFSFGTIVYEMLTGRRAFQGDTGVSTIVSILTHEPPPLNESSAGAPEALQSIVSRCLRKDPDRRFQTAADLRAALRDVRDELAFPGRTITTAKPAPRLHWPALWKWAAGVLVIAALAGAGVYWARHGTDVSGTSDDVLARSVPLTALRGNESNPSFSPDGTQIAFSWGGENGSNTDIYIKLVGPGRVVRITTDSRPDTCPSWSPDGRWIVFLRQLSNNDATLVVTPALGGRERMLVKIRTSYILGASKPAWSGDSKWLVISAATDQELQALARVNVESGELFWITRPDTSTGLNDVMPALAPSGRLLAFSRVGGGFISAAFVLPVSETLEATGKPRALDQGEIAALMPEWLNNDELIVATGGVQSTLWKIRVSQTAAPRPLVVPGSDVLQPATNSATRRLAYVTKRQDSNIWALETGTKPHVGRPPSRIISSTQADVNPQMSPNGNQVAFSSNRSGKYEIWIWDRESPDALQLTTLNAPTTGSPRWSPNGQEIAFDSNLGGRSNIYVINSGGGTPRMLTQNMGASIVPCWSKDGRFIYFGSNRSGTFQIWRMNADGSDATAITKNGGFAPLISPDGKSIYYARSPAMASDIWRAPVEGGEEIKVADGVYRYSFGLTPEGLYYVSVPEFQKGSAVRYLDFRRGSTIDVFTIPAPVDLGLGLSPDYKQLFFSQVDYGDTDIMLVENVN